MKKYIYCLVALCAGFLTACQRNDLTEGERRAVNFHVTNYEQYYLGDETRAESVDLLDHLTMAIYSADTDQLVDEVVTQNKGDENYGNFTAYLEEGVTYRIVFLGYMGSKACHLTSSKAISFDDTYVPHTFLYTEVVHVDESLEPSRNVVLDRVIGAFRLVMADAMPEGVATMRFTSTRGGSVLNAQTGECVQNTGRTYDMVLADPSSWWGKKNNSFTLYYFLPKTGATMEITVDALDSKGTLIQSRTFPEVPMTINQLTIYTGNFFIEPTMDYSPSLSLNYSWGAEKTYTY